MTETDTNILRERLQQLDSAIANYEELDSDLEAPEYVARGNGFCDSKYSEDFIEGQLAQLRNERAAVSAQLERLTATQA
ncbi:MAG: hypothetical protein IJM88_08155 [Bacteroidales bacterium]|nr:hypothetical protein [Bacteroidales bacterium]